MNLLLLKRRKSMFLQQIIQGLAIGSIYGLVALGYVLIWNTWGVLNFSQGDTAMIGAFFILIFYVWLKIPFALAFVLSIAASMAVAYIIERTAFRPLLKADDISKLIATIGIGIFLENLYRVIFGADPIPFPSVFGANSMKLGSVLLVPQNLWILIIGFTLVIILRLFLTKTYMGKSMRATAQDKEAALLMGVSVKSTMSFTFAMACGIGAVAGILVAPIFFITSDMGVMIGLKGFAAAVFGGIESMTGAMFGGIVLGIAENLGAAYISSKYQSAIAFLLMIIILIFKPSGIMGKKS